MNDSAQPSEWQTYYNGETCEVVWHEDTQCAASTCSQCMLLISEALQVCLGDRFGPRGGLRSSFSFRLKIAEKPEQR